MESAAIVTIVAVGLIVAALVVYLVGVILQLRKITAGLDEVIATSARSSRRALRSTAS